MTTGRSARAWAFPFLAATAMVAGMVLVQAAGSLVTGRAALANGAELVLRILPGLLLAVVAVGVSSALRFEGPGRVPLRLGLSGLAGGVAAVIVETAGGDFEGLFHGVGGARATAVWLLLVPAQPLVAWPWGAARRPRPPEPSAESLSRLAWVLPFLLAPGLSCGATIGFSIAAGDELGRDPMGSVLLVLTFLTLAGAFVVSLATVLVSKALRRPPPNRLGLRLLAGGVSGLFLGGLAWRGTYGSGAGLDLAALLVIPVALSWPWRSRAAARGNASPPLPPDAVALAFLALAGLATATPPPLHVTLELGVDSRGVRWRVGAGAEGPLRLFGDRAIELAPARRLEHMALSASIDAADRAWIVDASGHGVRVDLATGRFEPVALPVSRQLLGGLVADAGFVYLGDGDARGVAALARIDLAANRLTRLYEITAPRSFLAFGVGPRNAWVVSWDGLAGPRHVLHATAVEKLSGKLARQATLAVDWAAERWQGLGLDEDAGGNLWIADPYSGQVHRLDTTGAWRSWSFAPRAPAAVVVAGEVAVVQLVSRRAMDASLQPVGAATHEVTGEEVAVVTGADASPQAEPLERSHWGATLRRDRSGRMWLGPGVEVRVVQGRPRIALAR